MAKANTARANAARRTGRATTEALSAGVPAVDTGGLRINATTAMIAQPQSRLFMTIGMMGNPDCKRPTGKVSTEFATSHARM
jgi:hypothetical protein